MSSNIFPTTPDSGSNKKSWFSKPEGIFGTFFGIGALSAIGWYVLPILTTIIWNTVNFGIACVVGFLLVFMLSNKKLWMSFGLLYDILMKKLLGTVIELDPFIIAENYIRDGEKQREILLVKIEEVGGQKESLDITIKEKSREIEQSMNEASAAYKLNDEYSLALANAEVKRLEGFIQQLTPIRDNLTKVNDYLLKVYKNSEFMLKDMRNDLKIKKELHQSVTKGNNALKSAMKIFKGDPESMLAYEQSMDFLKEDIGKKIASMKIAINLSSDFMKSIDLKNASFAEGGLKMLEEYRPELFLGNTNNSINNPKPIRINIDNKNNINKSLSSGYNNLLD